MCVMGVQREGAEGPVSKCGDRVAGPGPLRGLCASVTCGQRRLSGWQGRAGIESEGISSRRQPRSFVHLESSLLLGQQVGAKETAVGSVGGDVGGQG